MDADEPLPLLGRFDDDGLAPLPLVGGFDDDGLVPFPSSAGSTMTVSAWAARARRASSPRRSRLVARREAYASLDARAGRYARPLCLGERAREHSRADASRLRFVAQLIMSSRRRATLHPTGLNRAAGAAPRVENDGARARREAGGLSLIHI